MIKKIILIKLIFFFSCCEHSSDELETSIIDNKRTLKFEKLINKEKQGEWYCLYKKDKVLTKGYFEADIKTGKWTIHYLDNDELEVLNFKNGSLNGYSYLIQFSTGDTIYTCEYLDNKQVTKKYFYKDNNITEAEPYEIGLPPASLEYTN